MAEVSTQGTVLKYGSTAVGQLLKLDAPEIERAKVKTTHLGTTTAHTYRPSALYDPGEISGTLQYDPTNTTHQHMTTSMTTMTVETWHITFADGSDASFSGFVSKFKAGDGIEEGDENNLEATFTLSLSGAVTFTPFAGP